MRRNLIKLSFFVLVLFAVLSFAIVEINAIGDTACRGTEWCDEIDEACFEGELLGWRKYASLCWGWGNCRSYFHIICWDEEEDDHYSRYIECDTPAMAGECVPPLP
jgi:hypothetical protein